MRIADYILLGVIFVGALCALIFLFKRKKKGCSGCSGCSGCNSCQSCDKKDDGSL